LDYITHLIIVSHVHSWTVCSGHHIVVVLWMLLLLLLLLLIIVMMRWTIHTKTDIMPLIIRCQIVATIFIITIAIITTNVCTIIHMIVE
jgi:hypothetical protein